MGSRYSLGIISLLSVVLIWVTSSFATNSIFIDAEYHKPFFVTYLNTASFALYLLFAMASRAKKGLFGRKKRRRTSAPTELDPLLPDNYRRNEARCDKLTMGETSFLGLKFCVLWFLANWANNAALGFSSVASVTILASTSGIFTLVIGALSGTDHFTAARVLSCVITLLGVILVTYPTAESKAADVSPREILGNALSLFGALCYACYSTLLKKVIGDEGRVDMSLFFGWVGVWNVIALWPGFIVLDRLGWEPWGLPEGSSLIMLLIVNALVGTFLYFFSVNNRSDYLWLKAVLLTSPLIPFALVGDIIFRELHVTGQYWAGAALVIAGFLTVNFSEIQISQEMEAPKDNGLCSVIPMTQEGVRERRGFKSCSE